MTLTLLTSLMVLAPSANADTSLAAAIDRIYPETEALYMELHRNPELRNQEKKTAATLAQHLQKLGFQITTGVGGTGLVALLKNGDGPTLMLRTELDALPVEEKTGLPYASKVTALDNGRTVSVMHACGHDVHMATLVAAATLLVSQKQAWRGTLMLLGQPAEEGLTGARAMMDDGLFTRFPKPDYALAIHVNNRSPAGRVTYRAGPMDAGVDIVAVTIYGKGGHASSPHTTIDPISIAARTVIALETIVNQENNPLEPAGINVGSFHAGVRTGIIPEDAKLELSVRALEPKVRQRLLAAVTRTIRGEAISAGAPREPTITVIGGSEAVVNDAELTERVARAVAKAIGADKVSEQLPFMGAEDFGVYGAAGVRVVMMSVGAAEPAAFADAQAKGMALPSNHSPLFAPDRVPTLKTAIATMVSGALELLSEAKPAVSCAGRCQ